MPIPRVLMIAAIDKHDHHTADPFDAVMPVKGDTDKHGVAHKPTVAKRKKRAPKSAD